MPLSHEEMAKMTDLAKEVTDLVHTVAARRLVQVMEHVHDTEIAPLRDALRAILAEPTGCVFCDYGVLRTPSKGHDSKCGFAKAHALLKD